MGAARQLCLDHASQPCCCCQEGAARRLRLCLPRAARAGYCSDSRAGGRLRLSCAARAGHRCHGGAARRQAAPHAARGSCLPSRHCSWRAWRQLAACPTARLFQQLEDALQGRWLHGPDQGVAGSPAGAVLPLPAPVLGRHLLRVGPKLSSKLRPQLQAVQARQAGQVRANVGEG